MVTETVSAILKWQAILGGSLTGASFNSADSNSAAEFDIAATAISDGIIVGSGYFTEKSNLVDITQFENTLLPGADIAGLPDIITLTAQRVDSAASTNVYGSFGWQEWD